MSSLHTHPEISRSQNSKFQNPERVIWLILCKSEITVGTVATEPGFLNTAGKKMYPRRKGTKWWTTDITAVIWVVWLAWSRPVVVVTWWLLPEKRMDEHSTKCSLFVQVEEFPRSSLMPATKIRVTIYQSIPDMGQLPYQESTKLLEASSHEEGTHDTNL